LAFVSTLLQLIFTVIPYCASLQVYLVPIVPYLGVIAAMDAILTGLTRRSIHEPPLKQQLQTDHVIVTGDVAALAHQSDRPPEGAVSSPVLLSGPTDGVMNGGEQAVTPQQGGPAG